METDAPLETEDQPTIDEAPDTGTSHEFEAPFDINSIEDEAVRGELDRRLKEMQGAFTKKTQSLAEERKQFQQAQQYIESLQTDPATRKQLLAELAADQGYELPDDEEADPYDRIQARLDAAEAREQARDKREQETVFVQTLEAQVEKDFAELGDLTEKQQKLIVDAAVSRGLTDEGFLDVKGVYQDFLEAAQAPNKAYRKSKQAPHVARAGVAGQAKVDLRDPEARSKHMLALVQAGMED